jgi:hypothetical protein
LGINTPVTTAVVTATVDANNNLSLSPNNGDLTMAKGLDTITFSLVNNNSNASARFTNTALAEADPWYLIRSAGPAGTLSYTRDSDTQLTLTDDNRNHGQGQDWMYKYGIRVAVTQNGATTILTFDPTIDDEDDTT